MKRSSGFARNAIVLGDFWHGASERGLAQGLREAGWNTEEVALLDHQLRSRMLALRLAARIIDPLSRTSYNRAIDAAVERVRPEFLLAVKGSYVDPAVIRRASAQGIVTALYYPDVNFHVAGDKLDERLIAEVDLLFTTKSFHMEYLDRLRGPGRSFLVHHGYSPLVHRPHYDSLEDQDFLFDLAYVGNPDASKLATLTEVARRFPKLRMMVAGDKWEGLASGTPLEGRTAKGRVTGDLMAEILQRSRISLAIQATPAGATGWRDYVSTRTFEIPACKGFMLHEDNEEVRTLFAVGKEIDVFSTIDDLCDKIEYYLARPGERDSVSNRGFERCVPQYSYYQRAAEMIDILDKYDGCPVKDGH